MRKNENPFSLINRKEFASSLPHGLANRGLGTLPVREVAILAVEQLLRHHPQRGGELPPPYELARLLRISPRRLRGILDDISHRDTKRNETTLREELREILVNAEKASSNDSVAFQVDNGLRRAFAQRLIQENYGMVDSSFSSSVIRISAKQFSALCASVLSPAEADAALITIRGSESDHVENVFESIAKQNVGEFSQKAAGRRGEKLVDLGFYLAAGGAHGVVELTNRVVRILG
jgi:hypothetical protein